MVNGGGLIQINKIEAEMKTNEQTNKTNTSIKERERKREEKEAERKTQTVFLCLYQKENHRENIDETPLL